MTTLSFALSFFQWWDYSLQFYYVCIVYWWRNKNRKCGFHSSTTTLHEHQIILVHSSTTRTMMLAHSSTNRTMMIRRPISLTSQLIALYIPTYIRNVSISASQLLFLLHRYSVLHTHISTPYLSRYLLIPLFLIIHKQWLKFGHYNIRLLWSEQYSGIFIPNLCVVRWWNRSN